MLKYFETKNSTGFDLGWHFLNSVEDKNDFAAIIHKDFLVIKYDCFSIIILADWGCQNEGHFLDKFLSWIVDKDDLIMLQYFFDLISLL